jgi:hypothetical protein
VKRTLNKGVKKTLKPCVYKRSKPTGDGVPGKVKNLRFGAEAKASLNRAHSQWG